MSSRNCKLYFSTIITTRFVQKYVKDMLLLNYRKVGERHLQDFCRIISAKCRKGLSFCALQLSLETLREQDFAQAIKFNPSVLVSRTQLTCSLQMIHLQTNGCSSSAGGSGATTAFSSVYGGN